MLPIPTLELRGIAGDVVAEAIVDDDDFERLSAHRWSLGSNGYGKRSSGNTTVLLHREVLQLQPGDGTRVDHQNRDRLDCRKSNLKLSTSAGNARNRNKNGTSSRFFGVAWHKQNAKWQAMLNREGKSVYLGIYEDELDAAQAVIDFLRTEGTI